MITVIDNFLTEEEHGYLCETLNSPKFPWYYNESSYAEKKVSLNDYPQLTHRMFYDGVIESPYYSSLSSLVYKLECERLLRVKINLNVPTINEGHGIPHIDSIEDNSVTAIYYVNDCDGDTVFFDSDKETDRVSPKKNRLVRFPSKIFHAGTPPARSEKRLLINLNYIPK